VKAGGYLESQSTARHEIMGGTSLVRISVSSNLSSIEHFVKGFDSDSMPEILGTADPGLNDATHTTRQGH
jgi:hypothetical protein